MNGFLKMKIHNFKDHVKSHMFEFIPCVGLHRLSYLKKRLKSYFLHRVISSDHPFYDYHVDLGQLTVSDFEHRLKYIMKHNRIVSLGEYFEIIRTGRKVSENLVLLTFDDGYRCFYENVFPLLKKNNIPAVIFVTANCVECQTVPPHDILLYALIEGIGTKLNIKYDRFSLEVNLINKAAVCSAYSKIRQYVKLLQCSSVASFYDYLFGIIPVDMQTLRPANEMLTWEQLREMHLSGLVDIGAHTMNHPILSNVAPDSLEYEILGSKTLIEKRINFPVTVFAYPNGRLIDISSQALNIVRSNFELAFCTLGRAWQEDNFLITRHGFDVSPGYFLPLIDSGIFDPFASYRLSQAERDSYLRDPNRISIPERMLL